MSRVVVGNDLHFAVSSLCCSHALVVGMKQHYHRWGAAGGLRAVGRHHDDVVSHTPSVPTSSLSTGKDGGHCRG